MQSGVRNRFSEQVEQLDATGTIFSIGEDAGATDLVDNSTLIPLVNGRVYEIRRIEVNLSYFNNPDLAPNDYAFAQYEQFSSLVYMDLAITDAAGNVQKDLFRNLPMVFEGKDAFKFEEPFTFDTTNSASFYLKITFKPQSFVFMAISLMVIPPAAGQQIIVYGSCSLVGVSYTLIDSETIQLENQAGNIAVGTNQPNLIDIDESF